MSTGSRRIQDLEEATSLQAEDQFIFFQNSTKRPKRVSRDKMLVSNGVATTLNNSGVGGVDSVPPALPQGLILTSSSVTGADGREIIIITAKITPNSDADLESYSWYLREIDASPTPPTFSGGDLTAGGVLIAQSQTPTYEISAKNNEGGYAVKVFRAVKANQWYLVKVAAIDKSGNYSTYTSDLKQFAYILTSRDTTPPGAPVLHNTTRSINPSTSAIKSVFLRWTNPSDSDLARVDVYRADSPSYSTYNKIGSAYGTAWTDSSSVRGTTYRYKLKAVDYSGNESGFSTLDPDPSSLGYLQITPGQIGAADIATFAVDATKIDSNTIALKGDVWNDNSPSSGRISWNAHSVIYGGVEYAISAGDTNLKYLYWTYPNTTYTATNTNPTASTLGDKGFVIATNINGAHDLAWNALANAIIGSAWIEDLAVTNAKINDLSADKITAGTIDSDIITLGEVGGSKGIIKSSGATSAVLGTGFWIEGGSSPIFAIGNLAGAPSMRFSASTLTVKGRIESSDGFFGTTSTNGVLIDEKGLSIIGDGVNAGNNARLRANLEWDNSALRFNTSANGFYLGKASTAGGSPVYRFFIGETGTSGVGGTNYLYWDGSNLKVGGTISGNIVGGTTVGSSGSVGLVMNTQFGIRRSVANGTLTMTGGDGNGVQYAAQIDLVGSFLNQAGKGQLILQAGYNEFQDFSNILDGAIVLRTSKSTTISGADIGLIRMLISKEGAVVIGRNPSESIGGPDGNDGELYVLKTIVAGGQDFYGSGGFDGLIYLKNSVNTTRITLSANSGDVSADSFTTSSSKNVKTNIKNLKTGIDAIDKLKPVSFKRKGTKQQDIGLIAEEVDKILPVIVKHNEKNEAEGLDYSKLSVILINAVKELSAEIKKLKKKLKDANSN